MIESFKEFSKKTSNGIFEELIPNFRNNLYDDVVLDAKDQEELKKGEPNIETVSDNDILSKMTIVVIKKLRENIIYDKFCVYPYILKIDGKKCSMICSESKSMFFAIYREGINKVITYFTENPINKPNAFSKLSVSTSKLGLTNAVNSLLAIFTLERNVNLNEEVTPAKPYSSIAYGTLYKRLYNEKEEINLVSQELMAQFIRLYQENDDKKIAKKLQDLTETDEYLETMRDVIGRTKLGTMDDVQTMRFVAFIHLIICKNTGNAEEKIATKLPNLWFWGAGSSGEIAIDCKPGKGYFVIDSVSVIEKKVDELQNKMDSVYDAAEAICKYIKSGGRDISIRREIGVHRGLLITGAAGIGKSVALDKAIKDVGLVRGLHYKNMSNSTTSAREVYKELYENNNMLLIYDDTPEMFNTEQKISLWKHALEKDVRKRWVVSPDGEVRGKSEVYYGAQQAGMTRQESYFREVGKFTPYEKEKWLKKKESEIRDYYKKKSVKYGTPELEAEISDESIKVTALREFEKFEEENAKMLIPDGFIFNGIIVYITNQTLGTFIKTVKDHWKAIKRRMEPIDISPTQKVVWYWLRRKIVNDMNNDSIPNELKMLPVESPIPDYNLEEVLIFIDEIIEGKYNTETEIYGDINWGTIANFREYLYYGQKRWKDKIKENMKIDATR